MGIMLLHVHAMRAWRPPGSKTLPPDAQLLADRPLWRRGPTPFVVAAVEVALIALAGVGAGMRLDQVGGWARWVGGRVGGVAVKGA